MRRAAWIFLGCLLVAHALAQQQQFPDDFLFGAATASYQIEGGWNAEDKGESIWDHLTHTQADVIDDKSNGDVACDSYHNFKRDVEMMRELNLDSYRFSLSWPRILPTGFPNKVSVTGVEFYNNYINEMLKYNIEPMVTLYHWDLPQALQDLGGWTNPYIVDWFSDFAKIGFENFGDRVKIWMTINEPQNVCHQGYGIAAKAPYLNASGIADYMCYHHLVLAHAKVYHLYDDEFKAVQGGKVGIAADMQYYKARSQSAEDEEVAQLVRDFIIGIFVDPIHSETGDYPNSVKEIVAKKSKEQGYVRSRLIPFTEDEILYIRGSYDYLAINHYTTYFVYSNESSSGLYPEPHLRNDLEYETYRDESWEAGASSWLYFDPESLYTILKYVREKYNNPEVYITENGWSTRGGLDDDDRARVYRTHLNGVLRAINEGSDVKGYMAWSMMDNFEWMRGYTEKFGLYEVDFEDPERKRTARTSAFVFKQIAKSRVIDPEYSTTYTDMWIDEGH